MDLRTPLLNNLLDLWLDEDLGRGDLAKVALNDSIVSAHWLTKQKGIFCGGPLVQKIFAKLDQSIQVNLLVKDGTKFEAGQKLIELQGRASALVAGERTSLNLAMHLSGIATSTAALVSELEGTGVRLADTRKTTPGLRIIEKYAVRCGGGLNHRMGLDDAAMLKENHIAWGNGIELAIKSIRENSSWTTKVIVEAETRQQATEAVKGGADGILLDEMSPEVIRQLVPELRKLAASESSNRLSKVVIIEVSGIDPTKIKHYAHTGIDLISTSAPITKSAWIDLSMRFNKANQSK